MHKRIKTLWIIIACVFALGAGLTAAGIAMGAPPRTLIDNMSFTIRSQ